MKLGALALFLAAAVAAIHLHLAGRSSSFASYSREQLQTLERAYQRAAVKKPAPGPAPHPGTSAAPRWEPLDAVVEAQVSLSLLQDEQQRRSRLIGAMGVAALAALGLVVLLRRSRPGRADEDSRFARQFGTPEDAWALERQKAAKLLGVSLDAPPHVVEAALKAQLLSRDPARLDGLAPELRRIALEQREAFLRARDCVLTKDRPAPRATPSPSDPGLGEDPTRREKRGV